MDGWVGAQRSGLVWINGWVDEERWMDWRIWMRDKFVGEEIDGCMGRWRQEGGMGIE